MTITVASWNIAGGRPMRSEGVFDYDAEDVDYFSEQLRLIDPDVVCLQETHVNEERSVAKEIAVKLGGYAVQEVTMSPSHVDENYSLGNAILSKIKPKNIQNVLFPYPTFPLFLPGGKPAIRHEKGFQLGTFDFGIVGNLQMMPLKFLGTPYNSEKGKEFARGMEETLFAAVSRPLLLCGDFNYIDPALLYTQLLSGMKSALPNIATRPDGKRTDYIFYSVEFVLKDSGVVQTNSDHFLCWATFEIE
jgi:endonuclease/exonuclease/phosphatase family metal-dependent hydrolase